MRQVIAAPLVLVALLSSFATAWSQDVSSGTGRQVVVGGSAHSQTRHAEGVPPDDDWSVSTTLLAAAGLDDHAQDDGAGSPLWHVPLYEPGWYAGVDFLLIRPQFSEAIAFVRGSQTLTSQSTRVEELDFSYQESVRAMFGRSWGCGSEALQFTYWHMEGDVSVDGTAPPGEFIIDPFGNAVGTIVVLDPNSALFGLPLPSGDAIATQASVRVDMFDIDVIKPICPDDCLWTYSGSLGVRIADVDQHYESVIASGGDLFSRGTFDASFVGAGPRVGLEGRRQFGSQGRLSLYGNAHMALLVGQYDVSFSSTTTVPGPFVASQESSLARTLTTLEAEIGATWRATDLWTFTAGWLFQSWFDLGASGGQFGGFFVGADDANIMSFDGLFLRAERRF